MDSTFLAGFASALVAASAAQYYIEGNVKVSTWHYSGVPESRVRRLDLSQKTGM